VRERAIWRLSRQELPFERLVALFAAPYCRGRLVAGSLLRDLGRLSETRCLGQAAAVAALPVQYADCCPAELFAAQVAHAGCGCGVFEGERLSYADVEEFCTAKQRSLKSGGRR
jgi:hypothetical protein